MSPSASLPKSPRAQALVRIHPMIIWFAHCFVPGSGYGILCPVLSSRARTGRRDHQTTGEMELKDGDLPRSRLECVAPRHQLRVYLTLA